jgi:EmrB/QacA subfamily drug resistance transporter
MTAAPSKWTVLGIVGTGVFMCTLDSSIVNVSLPVMARHFGVPVGGAIEWVMIAYLVTIAATLLTVGRLSDYVGRRRIWIAGLVVFTLGSAACGAAPALGLLIAARVLQGIGGSLLMAVSPAMLTAAFPAHERGRALGLNTTVVALGVSAGPAIGGVITELSSWRWIFYVNVPIGIAGAVSTLALLPPERRGPRAQFDAVGAISSGLALAALTGVLSFGYETGWGSPLSIAFIAAAVVASAIFVWQERRSPAALLDRSLFHHRVFLWANISLVLSFLAAFAIAFLLPFYFEQLRGFDPLHTGLLLTPFPITVAIIAPISGRLADRIGTRGLASTGMAILCLGLALISRFDAATSTWGVIWPQAVAALGQGLFQSPNNSAIMGAAPRDRQGIAAGVLATGRSMGQSLSIAIAGAVLVARGAADAERQLPSHRGDPVLVATFLRGFRTALLTCAGLAAIAIVTSLLRGRELRHPGRRSSTPGAGGESSP